MFNGPTTPICKAAAPRRHSITTGSWLYYKDPSHPRELTLLPGRGQGLPNITWFHSTDHLRQSTAMCIVTFFQHKQCGHMWAVVTHPCGPGMGFSTCRSFGDDAAAKEAPRVYRTRARPCPRCAADGRRAAYDANAVRLVRRMGWGLKLGAGQDEDDWGVDVRLSERGSRCVVL
ncbi:hypothetical protein HIM_06982 [Hirsutella minnesotensis 3608]|uniref:Uncharacterized protein n=1 Tax=Hirsutella minnesotensis 3608 TaxID=1043627 RepID=A0A0F8A4I7_9HYPO|nr:hypothetical protein HIM_06982 [Hirsutella minnesotensis 3608]